ncbi:MAG: hypothetical protein ABIH74_02285, partial [Candidatus Omnitrophota bacterium]
GKLYSGAVIETKGAKFAVVRCGIGPGLTGDAVLLMGATPVRRVIFVGACGGFGASRVGDIIVCEGAFDGEGFSRYHGHDFCIEKILGNGGIIPADKGYTERLKKFISGRIPGRDKIRSGNIFTTGSLLAEEARNMRAVEEKGFIGVDMELSAVYQAARTTRLAAAGLVFVSDLPLSRPLWETPADLEKEYSGVVDEVIRVSSEFACAR